MKQKVIELIEGLCAAKVENTKQTLKEDLGVNSLNIVMLIVAIEETFEIELAETDLNPSLFTTVDAVITLVDKYVRVKE